MTNATNYSTDNFTENIKHEFVPYDIPPELPKMETLPSLLFEENSQNLSESTLSQNEIFSISDPNVKSNTSLDSEIGFYQISESCTIVPSTLGLLSINTSNFNSSQFQCETQLPKSKEFSMKTYSTKQPFPVEKSEETPTKTSSCKEKLENNLPVEGNSELPNHEDQTISNQTEFLLETFDFGEEGNVKKETKTKNCGPFNSANVVQEVKEMEQTEIEMKNLENENDKIDAESKEEKLSTEEQHMSDVYKMDVKNLEELKTNLENGKSNIGILETSMPIQSHE